MLDLLTDNEDQTEKMENPSPITGDSDSSSTSELVNSKRLDDNGSPQIDQRRIVVSSSASKLNKNNNTNYAERFSAKENSTKEASHNENGMLFYVVFPSLPSFQKSFQACKTFSAHKLVT